MRSESDREMLNSLRNKQLPLGNGYKITALIMFLVLSVCICFATFFFYKEGGVEVEYRDDDSNEVVRIEAPRGVLGASVSKESSPEEAFPCAGQDVEQCGDSCFYTYTTPLCKADALEIMWDLPIRAQVQLEIEQMCAARDVDAAVVVAMIYRESRYDEKAIGDSCNSYGLMQIQPMWHEERMDRLGVTDLLNGVENVRVGIDYLDELLDKYDGDYAKALTAYNRGHYSGFVNNYAKAVLAMAEEMR